MATPKAKPVRRNKKLEKSMSVEQVETSTHNLQKSDAGKNKDINIKTTPDMHREFKTYATTHDMSMHELFFSMWEFYRKHHP